MHLDAVLEDLVRGRDRDRVGSLKTCTRPVPVVPRQAVRTAPRGWYAYGAANVLPPPPPPPGVGVGGSGTYSTQEAGTRSPYVRQSVRVNIVEDGRLRLKRASVRLVKLIAVPGEG